MDKLVLFDPVFEQIQQKIDWLAKNKHAIVNDMFLSFSEKQANELQKSDEFVKKESEDFPPLGVMMPESPSVNLQDLHEFTNWVLKDINESINSNILTGDMERDNERYFMRKTFLEERCKNYAHQLYDMITNMISIDGYDISFFKSYDIIYNLAVTKEGMESAIYLKRLVGIARMILPPMQRYFETSIVDAGITSKSNMQEFGSK
ncbi:MAG: hypothetical protein K5793_03760 [Nitrosarchaeum sp.]|nr:hypothetical protein [Nitrosarchaeum sp.]